MEVYELIKEVGNQRTYKVPFKIRKYYSWGKVKNFSDLIEAHPIKLREGFTLIEDSVKDGTNYVVVSDANTHTERLCFYGFEVIDSEGIKHITHNSHQIAGYLTFMSRGGSSEAVYPDKVYLRFLRMINKEAQDEQG